MIGQSLKDKKVLVTGGAGFIGANLVEELLKLGTSVRVLDNLATGHLHNIQPFLNNPLFEFLEGDICSESDCKKAVEGIDLISHQAALGSVPRSIEYPHNTHKVNATGFLNILQAAKEAEIKRFVYASSSSVYGDSLISPKTIGSEGNLLSPYAVTKQLNEKYASVYHLLHGMETIGLRYFNVFGPKQDPNGVYAAAIPKFIHKMMMGEQLIINGDGEQTRDFTYVGNAVKANVLALTTTNQSAFGRPFNVACGNYYSLNQVVDAIAMRLKERNKYNDATTIIHGPERAGDIRDSLADINEIKEVLNYTDIIQFEGGISSYIAGI